jgi:hypothetical protein
MVARAVEQVTSFARVQIEEDTRDNDHALLETGLEEVQAVGDSGWEASEVEPKVEGRVRNIFDDETHLAEAIDDIVALGLFRGWLGGV